MAVESKLGAMLTRFWIIFISPALGNVAPGDIGYPYHPRFNSTSDGYTLFNKTTTFQILGITKSVHDSVYLQKRNYNPQNITFNHTICMNALTWKSDSNTRVLTTMFFVSPLKSRSLVTSVVMNFSYDNISKGYNILHSTPFVPDDKEEEEEEEERKDEKEENEKEEVYDYPLPQWRFLYVEENCTVVQLLNNTTHAQAHPGPPYDGKLESLPNCELWDIFKGNESTKCDEFFKCYCDTTNVTTVNLGDICWGKTGEVVPSSGNGDSEEEGSEEDEEEEDEDEDEEEDDDDSDETVKEQEEKEGKEEKKEAEREEA
ncbi:uncharacterized protein LOC144160571 [Haemaphysalis longicornis]